MLLHLKMPLEGSTFALATMRSLKSVKIRVVQGAEGRSGVVGEHFHRAPALVKGELNSGIGDVRGREGSVLALLQIFSHVARFK